MVGNKLVNVREVLRRVSGVQWAPHNCSMTHCLNFYNLCSFLMVVMVFLFSRIMDSTLLVEMDFLSLLTYFVEKQESK